MATVKLRFRRSTVAGKEGTLYFRITHGRISRQVNTGYRIFADEWDGSTLKLPDTDVQQERRSNLLSIEEKIKRDMVRINGIIRQMDLSGKEYTAAQVVDAFLTADGNGGELNEFVRTLTLNLKRIGKERLAETYTTTANSFMRFCIHHVVLYAQPSGNLQPRRGAGTDRRPPAFQTRIYRHWQDRQARRACAGNTQNQGPRPFV